MNWLEKVKNSNLFIQTGDGEVYEFLLLGASKSQNMNAVPLEFYNIAGALVKRSPSSYVEYELNLYIQGEDHLNEANRFEVSKENTNNWVIRHPYYDDIVCQLVKYDRDNNGQNVTKFTLTVYETIEINNTSYFNPKNVAKGKCEEGFDKVSSGTGKMKVNSGEAKSISNKSNIASNKLKKGAFSESNLSDINGKINKLIDEIGNIGTEPERYMRQLTEVFRSPSKFYSTISVRVKMFQSTFVDMVGSTTVPINTNDMIYKECASGALLISMAYSTLFKKSDIALEQGMTDATKELETRKEVNSIIEILKSSLNLYNDMLTSFQSSNAGAKENYIPSLDVYESVVNSIIYVISNLRNISETSKIERIYYTKTQESLIPLVYKLTGDISNENIQQFISINELVQSDILLIPEGKKLIYYK